MGDLQGVLCVVVDWPECAGRPLVVEGPAAGHAVVTRRLGVHDRVLNVAGDVAAVVLEIKLNTLA